MFLSKRTGKAIVSILICLAMLIGFFPQTFLTASAVTPTLTITEFHLTNNNTYPQFVNNSCPKGSVKWTTTGIDKEITGAKIFFSDMAEADFLNNELTDPDPYQFSRAWALTVFENDCGTVTSTGGTAMGDFMWLPTTTEDYMGGFVKGAVQIALYTGLWETVYTSPWYDVHQNWEITDPYMNKDAELMFDYKWSPLDHLADLGAEDNNKYEAEIYVWPGWNVGADPYSASDCWIMTVPFVAEEDITSDLMQYLTLSGGFYYNELYPAFSGTAPALEEGMKVTLGVEVFSDYGRTLEKRMPPVRFTVSGGGSSKVTQPTCDQPWEGVSWTIGVDRPGPLEFNKSDGSFTFDSLLYDGKALTIDPDYNTKDKKFAEGTAYAVPKDMIISLNWDYLCTLGAGTHVFTLHYTGEAEDGTKPIDPTLTIKLKDSVSPTVTVLGYQGTDITGDCEIVWSYASSGRTVYFPVATGNTVSYTVTPGDSLKVDGVQYYESTSGEVTLTEKDQAVNIQLTALGTVTAVPKAGGKEITGDYDVIWYSKELLDNARAGETDNAAGGGYGGYYELTWGKTSSKVKAGTVLYVDIIMSGENADMYPNVEKQPVTVGFGNSKQDIAVGSKNIITLDVTNDDLTEKDYTITWYEASGTGSDRTYRKIATGRALTNLGASVGKTYYYEIAPNDYYKNGSLVYNWLKFRGIPLDEDKTAVTVTDEAQKFEVTLSAVTTKTLSGTITNGAAVGVSNMTFTLTQDPFAGYLRGSSYYSYGAKWNAIEITSETVGDAVTFSATVYDFGATLKITEKTGNFRTLYKTVSAADLDAALSLKMSSENLPDSIPLTITKQYPDGRAENRCGYSTLSRGSWYSDEGIFNDMKFTLYNFTKQKEIDKSLYEVTPSQVTFIGDVSGVIEMGDKLILSYTVDSIAGEVDKTSSTVTVLRNYYEAGYDWNSRQFNLSYKDMPNVYFTSPDGLGTKHTIALYNEDGELADTVDDTYYGWTHSVPAGTYTIVNFLKTNWLSAPATLEGLQAILSSGEYLSKSITMENGLCTVVNFDASPAVGDHKLFTENSKFSDETVKASVDEWALVKLAFEVEPAIAKANPGMTYAITVTTTTQVGHTDEQDILPRYEASHTVGVASPDKYISLYCNNKLTESTVTINAKDAWHLGNIKGFTLYTTETSGEIWFYIQAPKGGDFPITAAGGLADANGNALNPHTFGNMTFAVTAADTSLCFNSDYLRTSDNGPNLTNYNNAWIYTIPGGTVDLYMDGVRISSSYSTTAGVAKFQFAMNDSKVGQANVSTFRANDPGWTVAGYHELYAETTKNGNTVRSAVATMECVTKANFTPAVIKTVSVKCFSDYEKDSFNGSSRELYNGSGNVASYYYSLSDKGNVFTYDFTVEMEDGDKVADEGMLLTVTAQNGENYYTMLERVEGTNKFVGSVSDEKLLFTNWSVSVKSKADITIKGDYIGDEDAFLAAYGNVKINDPKTGEEMTVTQYYQQEYDKLVDTYLDEQEQYIQDRQEVLDLFLDGMKQFDDILEGSNFDYSTFDGSEESMKELMAHFGIYEGVYADIPASVWEPKHISNKVVWPNGQIIWTDETFMPYAETVGPGGRIIRATTTEEIDPNTHHLICVQYAAVLPREDVEGDEGYSYIQGIDCGEVADSIAIPIKLANNNRYNAGEVLEKLKLGSGEKHFPTMSKKGIQNLGNCSNILNAIHKNVVGRNTTYSDSLAGWRAKLNVGALQDDHRQQTKAEIGAQTAVDGILDSGKLSGDDLDLAKDIKNDIDAICKATETADFASAMKIMMENINIVAESLSEVKEGVTDFLEKGFKDKIKDDLKQKAIDEAKEAIEDKTGISIPTDLKEACSLLLEVYASGKLSEAEKRAVELYLKTQALAKKTKTRIPPEAGGNGKNGITGRGSGGSARATHDPEGIIYEAVLSNPVEGATATLYEKTAANPNGEVWDAEEYGQINPQVTNGSGWYQWFVPEGEWQVRVTAPEGSGLSNNTSADNPAANLDDGSTAGWLPVMPVQLGINIPLVSDKTPEIEKLETSNTSIDVVFSLYMEVSTLTSDIVTLSDGTNTIACDISFPDKDVDPLNETKFYAKTMSLTPKTGSLKPSTKYTVSIAQGAVAYNGKALEATAEDGNTPDGYIPGDLDGDNEVTDSDVEYLLFHVLFPDLYPIDAKAASTDFNGDNETDDSDVEYLLFHVLFPDLYPLA